MGRGQINFLYNTEKKISPLNGIQPAELCGNYIEQNENITTGIMNITCNGNPTPVEPDTTLAGLVASFELNPKTMVAEVNGRIIEHTEFDTIQLKDGDSVELIRFVGGG